jgi:hypothetical protein
VVGESFLCRDLSVPAFTVDTVHLAELTDDVTTLGGEVAELVYEPAARVGQAVRLDDGMPLGNVARL